MSAEKEVIAVLRNTTSLSARPALSTDVPDEKKPSSITTKTGDKRYTDMKFGRIKKNSPYIRLMGKIDTLQSAIGAYGAGTPTCTDIQAFLYRVLAQFYNLEIDEDFVKATVRKWTRFTKTVQMNGGFVIPRSPLHLARCFARETELALLDFIEECEEKDALGEDYPYRVKNINCLIPCFNRLSDYIYALAEYRPQFDDSASDDD